MSGTRFATTTIANGAAVSSAFDLNGYRIAAVITPGTWTAADVSFEVETVQSSGAYVKVVDRAGALFKLAGIATAVSEMHLVAGDANQTDVIITSPGRAKFVSTNAASEADANQGQAVTLIAVLIPIGDTFA